METMRRLRHWWRVSGRWSIWLFWRSLPPWTRPPIRWLKSRLRWLHLSLRHLLLAPLEEAPAETRHWYFMQVWRMRRWWRFTFVERYRSLQASLRVPAAIWWRWSVIRTTLKLLPKGSRPACCRILRQWENLPKWIAVTIGRSYEKLRQGRSRAIAHAIASHIRLWLAVIAVAAALLLLHQFPFWRYWTSHDVQQLIDIATSYLPAAWAKKAQHHSSRFWITLAVAAGLLIFLVPLGIAVLVVRQHRRRERYWQFEVRHARPQLLEYVLRLGSEPDTSRRREPALQLLMKYRDGLEFLLPELRDLRNEMPRPLLRVAMVRGWVMLAAAIPHPDAALIDFLRAYREGLQDHHEGRHLLNAYFQWRNWEGWPDDHDRGHELLLRDLDTVRRRFQDPQWVAKYAPLHTAS